MRVFGVVALLLLAPAASSSRIDLPLISVEGDPPVQRFAAVALRIGLGTRSQSVTLLYDSGSPLSWTWRTNAACSTGKVPPYDPWKSSSARLTGERMSFTYGEGRVDGPTLHDTWTFELDAAAIDAQHNSGKGIHMTDKVSMAAPIATVEFGYVAARGFGDCIDGLYGADMASVVDIKGLGPTASVFGVLYPSPRQGDVGRLSLGGLDEAAYTGSLMWVPTVPVGNRTHPSMSAGLAMAVEPRVQTSMAVNAMWRTGGRRAWQVQQSNPNPNITQTHWWQLALDGGIMVGDSSLITGSLGTQAIVDTGTSFCVGSPSVVRGIQAAIGEFKCDPSTWADLPVISFRFGDHAKIQLLPEDYISVSANAEGESCSLLFVPNSAVPDSWFVLGAPIFWRYYVAFDRAAAAVGFALAAPAASPSALLI